MSDWDVWWIEVVASLLAAEVAAVTAIGVVRTVALAWWHE